MARARTAPAADEEVQPTLHEQQQAEDGETHDQEEEGEVRADELTRGTDAPVASDDYAFPPSLVEELRKPLDPNRVRRRKGRGGGQFEYLAGHDVKRRMNELFGFGGWSTEVRELASLGEVEVIQMSDGQPTGTKGWHVAYRATVRVSVLRQDGRWAHYEDTGYGDGNEWGAAALITARELALKESVTDALKRACTTLGDQFGLILYAKADEKQRIQRDTNTQQAAAVRRENEIAVPSGISEALKRFDKLVGFDGEGAEWCRQMVEAMFDKESFVELNSGEKQQAFAAFASALIKLEEKYGDLTLTDGVREKVAAVFAADRGTTKGVALIGPAWALDGEEAKSLPSRESVIAERAKASAAA